MDKVLIKLIHDTHQALRTDEDTQPGLPQTLNVLSAHTERLKMRLLVPLIEHDILEQLHHALEHYHKSGEWRGFDVQLGAAWKDFFVAAGPDMSFTEFVRDKLRHDSDLPDVLIDGIHVVEQPGLHSKVWLLEYY